MNNRKLIRVREVMQQHFLTIDGLTTVKEAIEALRADEATSLIVRKRHDDDEVGIVLLADIAKKVLARDKAPERVNVYEVMSKPVISVAPEMDVRYCARLFDRFGLAKAPVIENGEVIGIVDYPGLVLHGLLEIYNQGPAL
jgi:predicted transcriptional regulator